MPPATFIIVKNEADQAVRTYRNHVMWGIILFRALRRELKGKSKQEVLTACEVVRGEIEQRSLHIPHDRMILLAELKKVREEFLDVQHQETKEVPVP